MNQQTAIAMGARFLEATQCPSGEFRDFRACGSPSTKWVSGYVGFELSEIPGAETYPPLQFVSSYVLRSQRPSGGWGYHAGAPADADSTAWCIRFLSKPLGLRSHILPASWSTLYAHKDPLTGGYRTYLPSVLQLMTESGYCHASPCVTANVALSLCESEEQRGVEAVRQAVEYIFAEQEQDGAWTSYWWAERTYVTSICTSFLETVGHRGTAHEAATAWLRGSQLPDGSWPGGSFGAAYGINGLCGMRWYENESHLKRGADYLLRSQLKDGSWGAPPLMRVPSISTHTRWHPDDCEPVLPALDRVLTTAAALGALCRLARLPM
jgi:prenyltransferase beta subunit